MLRINEKLIIPDCYISYRFCRSCGPGGQNVNKVNTQVQLVFDLKHWDMIPQTARQRLIRIAAGKVTASGKIIINSTRHRTQLKNKQDCHAKLREMILQALIVPKKRRPSKPSAASKQRRLDSKKINSQRKQLRRNVSGEY